jgi:aminopeptidase N
MHNRSTAIFFLCVLSSISGLCQAGKSFTRADTLRGSITPERAWWNVLRYDISVRPDYINKLTEGKNTITYKVLTPGNTRLMQIDLQEPLMIDSVVFNQSQKLSFRQDGNAWFVQTPSQKKGEVNKVAIYFHGSPHEAKRAPWDGGWTFTKDSLDRPWMTVTCQGLGASIWYPCKDHQSDEPEKGASLTMRVPDTLVAVGNGRLASVIPHGDGTTSYRWEIINPINNYNIIPYIGKYVHFNDRYKGEKGILDLDYWVLDYNESKAKSYLPKEVDQMLKSFEHWFGPYPFYEDGYKLVDVPHTGMEHQSAVAYGNQYRPGYRNRDGSGTGWGMKWDFIVVHESGHEWFGNNITSNDLADMWVHEGFTNYSETLFIDYIFGIQAANEYNAGIRKGIRNDRPIIPAYGVNSQGSGDMYPKAGNMLHAIRHSMDDDEKFRKILRGINKDFYHQTVNSSQLEAYISKQAGFNYSAVFDQYLRDTQIPLLEIKADPVSQKVSLRYTNCRQGFNLPVVLTKGATKIKLLPTTNWSTVRLTRQQLDLLTTEEIKKMFYVGATVSSIK